MYNSESLKQIVYAPWSISADLSRSHAFGIGRPRLHGPLPPEVSADMVLNDRSVDLIEEGFDAVIRVGHSADSRLVARHLATVHFAASTTPEYVARHGAPRTCKYHNCVLYSLGEGHGERRFAGPDGEESVQVSGRLKANNGNFLRIAIIKGGGIGLAPIFLVGEDLAAG